MADYKKMYTTLVGEVSSTIDHLMLALEEAENLYIDTDTDDEEQEASE